MYNARLYLLDGTFLAMPDAWWPRAGVAGEVDSLRHHILAKDHEETMARRNRMEAAGVTDTQTFLLTKLSAPTDSNTAIHTARQRT
jgi:hypothetical protein